jgi:hypothetical protein
MKSLAISMLLALLAGCAPSHYAECLLPVTREAGMGVRVTDCVAWRFGPTSQQQAEFERRRRK